MSEKASKEGKLLIAKHLTARGANIEASDGQGNTPLHLAAMEGQSLLVQFLKERGANLVRRLFKKIQWTSINDVTALGGGGKGFCDLILLLYSKICFTYLFQDHKDFLGMTPLHFASMNNHVLVSVQQTCIMTFTFLFVICEMVKLFVES